MRIIINKLPKDSMIAPALAPNASLTPARVHAPSSDVPQCCANSPSFSSVTEPIPRLGVLITRKNAASSSGINNNTKITHQVP